MTTPRAGMYICCTAAGDMQIIFYMDMQTTGRYENLLHRHW